jgi:hypothetical protein
VTGISTFIKIVVTKQQLALMQGSMTPLVTRAPPNNNNKFIIGCVVNISLKLNPRECDRPMMKLLLLGGARFTNSVIATPESWNDQPLPP